MSKDHPIVKWYLGLQGRDILWLWVATTFLLFALMSCGGHDSIVPPSDNASRCRLEWVQPPYFADNTPLVVNRDVNLFEIHEDEEADFDDNTVAAVVSVVENPFGNRFSFDMNLLPTRPGPMGTFVSVRAIGTDNAASGFGEPAYWEAK